MFLLSKNSCVCSFRTPTVTSNKKVQCPTHSLTATQGLEVEEWMAASQWVGEGDIYHINQGKGWTGGLVKSSTVQK